MMQSDDASSLGHSSPSGSTNSSFKPESLLDWGEPGNWPMDLSPQATPSDLGGVTGCNGVYSIGKADIPLIIQSAKTLFQR